MPGNQLDLAALVANRTLSPDTAALLEAVGGERRSFLTFAVPRLAGKSTVLVAVLECAPPGTPIHILQSAAAFARAAREPAPGYLVIPEVAPYAVMPGYLWGEPVRRAFALLEGGLSLATALHAPDAGAAFRELSDGNGVPDADLARLEFAVEIRSLGSWQAPRRRVVAAVHQVLGVSAGIPALRLLQRWHESDDRFEAVAAPLGLRTVSDLTDRAQHFAAGLPGA